MRQRPPNSVIFSDSMRLAEQAIASLASRLGISVAETAYAIYTTANHNMVGAIEDITIREGLNPRDSYFVCGGGGTAVHIAEMTKILGLSRYIIPRFMAGLSAFGGLISGIRWETGPAMHTDAKRFRFDDINQIFDKLLSDARDFLNGANVAAADQRFELSFLGRYEYQSWEIDVPFEMPEGGIQAKDIEDLCERFHKIHECIYSIRNDNDLVEFTRWNVRAIGKRKHQNVWRDFKLDAQTTTARPKGEREIFLQENLKGAFTTVPVYELTSLGAGAFIEGPAIIEAETYTAVFLPRHQVEVDVHGNLLVNVAQDQE